MRRKQIITRGAHCISGRWDRLKKGPSSLLTLVLLLCSGLFCTFGPEAIEAQPTTLRVIGPWGGMEMDSFLQVLEAFENETGIHVEYNQTYAFDLVQTLPGEFEAGGTPGDVIFVWPWFVQEMGLQGHALDVTASINESDFLAGIFDPVRIGNTIYGGSYTGKAKPGFWYRKSFFAAHGLAEPADWNEFLALLSDIATVEGIVNPIASGDGVGWPLSDIVEHFLITFGGPQLHRNLTSGKIAWNSSGVRSIFADKLVPLLQGNFSDPIEWTTALDLWWQGYYGLYFMGSWTTSMVDNATDLGVFSLPDAEGLVFGADYFFVPAYTEYPDQALALFTFLSSAEAQEIQVAQGGHVATNIHVSLDAYPEADRGVAELLVGKDVLYDLDDTVGGDFQITFWDQMKRLWVDPSSLDDVLDALEAAVPRPVVWIVDDDGRADFHAIQEAVNHAYPRDIVYVLPGTYYENVVLNKTVSLVGHDVKATIVDGNGTGTVFTVVESNVNITNFTIRNSLSDAQDGIWIYNSSHVTIYGNNITDNHYGVYVYDSSNVSIFGNTIGANDYGVAMGACSSNTLFQNCIVDNSIVGLLLANSPGNRIHGNDIVNNYYGVHIGDSDGNRFYHNSFIDNVWAHAYVATINCTSFWDNHYPSGGNYWDDYNDTDLYRGQYQNETGVDGIGDTQYVIDESNVDEYPLIGPFGPHTVEGENVTVFPLDDVGLIFENVTAEGDTTANKLDEGPEPPTGLVVEQYYAIETTARYTGHITIRIIYDDSNLTQEDEESLQLVQHSTIPGDVDGDFDVDIYDIVLIAGAYNTHRGDQRYIESCDLDFDGDIDIYDVVIAAGNYAKSLEPPQRWTNITTLVDTQNNVIYGKAIHLSIFGVTRHF